MCHTKKNSIRVYYNKKRQKYSKLRTIFLYWKIYYISYYWTIVQIYTYVVTYKITTANGIICIVLYMFLYIRISLLNFDIYRNTYPTLYIQILLFARFTQTYQYFIFSIYILHIYDVYFITLHILYILHYYFTHTIHIPYDEERRIKKGRFGYGVPKLL